MKTNKFIVFILAVNGIFAQQITTAKIEGVTKNGLHKIVVPTEIRSFSKEDLSDFRIFDSKKTEVPYFIIQGNKENLLSSFAAFEVISKTVIPRKNTTIIFENPKTSIGEIVLSISNSDAIKPFSISGSNDQKEWFGLINNSLLSNLENGQGISSFKIVRLPLSSYHYLKISLDDRKTLPINILKIGHFITILQNKSLEEIIPKSLQTGEVAAKKTTRIHVIFDHYQIVNQLDFNITNPHLFNRKARIYLIKTEEVKRKKKTFQETIADFDLNSEVKNTITIPQLFEKDFYIEIENKDNQSLTFSGIRFFQNQIALIANLNANEKYSIKTGNSRLNAPDYDLENFISKISNTLPEAKITKIKHPETNKKVSENRSFWQQSWFMWLCISVGGIALIYFTTSLVKDMKNKP